MRNSKPNDEDDSEMDIIVIATGNGEYEENRGLRFRILPCLTENRIQLNWNSLFSTRQRPIYWLL